MIEAANKGSIDCFWRRFFTRLSILVSFNPGVNGNYQSINLTCALYKTVGEIEAGDLDEICALAKELKLAVYLGLIERAKNRGGHSLYCSLVYINEKGFIRSVHRKLQPTYDERLTWAQEMDTD